MMGLIPENGFREILLMMISDARPFREKGSVKWDARHFFQKVAARRSIGSMSMRGKLLSGIAALLMATSAAHAKDVRESILPPPKYDHLYEGRIAIIHGGSSVLPCRPRSLSIRLSCAYLEEDTVGNYHSTGKECVIFLASQEEIKEAGYTESVLLRREMARCNGWEGYRRLPYEVEADKKLDKELSKITAPLALGGAPTVQTKGSTLVCPGSRWRYVVTDAGVEHHSLPSTPPLSPYVKGDGYYKYHDLATVWYLRFYPDGTVVMDERLDTSSFPTADTLNKTWCSGIGIFETDDHLIKFQLRIGGALVPLDFNGQAWSKRT